MGRNKSKRKSKAVKTTVDTPALRVDSTVKPPVQENAGKVVETNGLIGNGAHVDGSSEQDRLILLQDQSLKKCFQAMKSGCQCFRKQEYRLALEKFDEALMEWLVHSKVLAHVTSKLDEELKIHFLDFHGNYGDGCVDDVREREIVHRVAVLLRNTGISLYHISRYDKAERLFHDCTRFHTTRLEFKTYHWRSMALLKLGCYEEARSVFLHGSVTTSLDIPKATNLFRMNEEFKHSQASMENMRWSRRCMDEANHGIYDFDKLFAENEPGSHCASYNLHGVRLGKNKNGKPALFAERNYERGELIFVSKALVSSGKAQQEGRLDAMIIRTHTSSKSTLFAPIRKSILEQRRAVQIKESLRTFCEELEDLPKKTDGQGLEDAYVQLAKNLGTVNMEGNVDMDHMKFIRNLLIRPRDKDSNGNSCSSSGSSDSANPEELLSKNVGESNKRQGAEWKNNADSSLKNFKQFCEKNSIDAIEHPGMQLFNDNTLDMFVRYCIDNKGTDPFADMVMQKYRDGEMDPAIIREICSIGQVRVNNNNHNHEDMRMSKIERERLIRKQLLLFRDTSYNFENGADMLLMKMGCDLENQIDKKQTCVWFLPSFLTHNCIPNAVRWNFGTLCFVQACQDINKGDEVTVCFSQEVFHTPSILKQQWGIECDCEYCVVGGASPPPQLQKWHEVLKTKVLPKLEPSQPPNVVQKCMDYAIRLLEKLESLVDTWLDLLQFENAQTKAQLGKVHFLEHYYAVVNALEARPEREFRIQALELRVKRIKEDCAHQFGLITLVGKYFFTLQNNLEMAKHFLPFETGMIKRSYFTNLEGTDSEHNLVTNTMRALQTILNFTSLKLVD